MEKPKINVERYNQGKRAFATGVTLAEVFTLLHDLPNDESRTSFAFGFADGLLAGIRLLIP
jgi:phage/plasmid primase-like uncharacterized protein